jgi:putative OmpL-like beta-barrel porin-2
LKAVRAREGASRRLATVLGLSSVAALARAQVSPPPCETSGPRPFLMEGLEAAGAKLALDEARVRLYGWVEQSYTWNVQTQTDRLNALRGFDDRSNDYRFDQLALNAERALSDGSDFDWGGKIELQYGSDTRFFHEAGLRPGSSDDTVQFDPVEFWLKVRIPLGEGLTVRAGKLVTPIGFETIDAPANLLFSHSILYEFGEPFTHAGIHVAYPVTSQWTAFTYLLRGWDQWIDANDTASHVAGSTWTTEDGRLSLTAQVITGPEQKNDNTDYRTLVDFVGTCKVDDAWTTTVNADWAYERDAIGDRDGRWWGMVGYGTWRASPQVAATARTEYFVDQDGSRLGFTADVLDVTLGVDWSPFRTLQNLRLRPEVRWDHAFGDRPFDAGTTSDQGTIALDVIFTF